VKPFEIQECADRTLFLFRAW